MKSCELKQQSTGTPIAVPGTRVWVEVYGSLLLLGQLLMQHAAVVVLLFGFID